jgi:hypothetical protein
LLIRLVYLEMESSDAKLVLEIRLASLAKFCRAMYHGGVRFGRVGILVTGTYLNRVRKLFEFERVTRSRVVKIVGSES